MVLGIGAVLGKVKQPRKERNPNTKEHVIPGVRLAFKSHPVLARTWHTETHVALALDAKVWTLELASPPLPPQICPSKC